MPFGELMNYVIVYWSRYGNGKKLVDHLAEKLKKAGDTQVFKTDEADPATMPEADVYVFSAPTEAFSVQREMKSFMKQLEGMEEKKYGLINTHAMKKSTIHKMEKILSKKKMIKVADVDFLVEGANIKTGEGLTKDWETKIDEFAGKL